MVGALGTIPEGLVKALEDLEIKWRQVGTIQTKALLRSGRILRRVLETWEDLLLLTLMRNYQLTLAGKILKGVNNNNIGILANTREYMCVCVCICNERQGEKAWCEQRKNVTGCFEQILEAPPLKTAAVGPLTCRHKNHPSKTNKTCEILLEQQRRTLKRCSSLYPDT